MATLLRSAAAEPGESRPATLALAAENS
jgi:hypothetical protein